MPRMVEQRLYDGTNQRELKQWMTDSAASTGNYHHVGGPVLVIHPEDTVYRTDEGGFGTICPHLRWAADVLNVDWR